MHFPLAFVETNIGVCRDHAHGVITQIMKRYAVVHEIPVDVIVVKLLFHERVEVNSVLCENFIEHGNQGRPVFQFCKSIRNTKKWTPETQLIKIFGQSATGQINLASRCIGLYIYKTVCAESHGSPQAQRRTSRLAAKGRKGLCRKGLLRKGPQRAKPQRAAKG